MPKKRILPEYRPQIKRPEIESIIAYHKAVFPQLFKAEDYTILVGIRGYFPNTFGNDEANNDNCYDDAIIGISPRYYKTFNANVDPSFVKDPKDGRALARLKLGVYRFYKGKHKSEYDALRAYPEGVQLPCTRAGVLSLCQLINIHYGGENPASWYVTWSHGCQTIPKTQFLQEFQPEIYAEMTKYSQKTVVYILIEKTKEGFRAGNGQIIPQNFQVEQLAADSQPDQPVPIQSPPVQPLVIDSSPFDQPSPPPVDNQPPASNESPVIVPQINAAPQDAPKTTGIQASYAWLMTFLTTFGGGVYSLIRGAQTELIYGFFGAAAVIGIVFIWRRFDYVNKKEQREHDAQMQREKQAFELQRLTLEAAADKNKNTVRIAPSQIQNSDAPQPPAFLRG